MGRKKLVSEGRKKQLKEARLNRHNNKENISVKKQLTEAKKNICKLQKVLEDTSNHASTVQKKYSNERRKNLRYKARKAHLQVELKTLKTEMQALQSAAHKTKIQMQKMEDSGQTSKARLPQSDCLALL
ncbi:hypothetical protein B0H34DRAFT_844065 [Crassisporium funariophilum]|nr:hypothetical protein B0H34DRAFT_844065 [Crassisporium funariophilum]